MVSAQACAHALVVVAHIGDETLFAGEILLGRLASLPGGCRHAAWHIVSVTGGNPVLENGFRRVMRVALNRGLSSAITTEVWNFAECSSPLCGFFGHQSGKPGPSLSDRLHELLQDPQWDFILTHNQHGEYGNVQNVGVHQAVLHGMSSTRTSAALLVFNPLPELNLTVSNGKVRLWKCYFYLFQAMRYPATRMTTFAAFVQHTEHVVPNSHFARQPELRLGVFMWKMKPKIVYPWALAHVDAIHEFDSFFDAGAAIFIFRKMLEQVFARCCRASTRDQAPWYKVVCGTEQSVDLILNTWDKEKSVLSRMADMAVEVRELVYGNSIFPGQFLELFGKNLSHWSPLDPLSEQGFWLAAKTPTDTLDKNYKDHGFYDVALLVQVHGGSHMDKLSSLLEHHWRIFRVTALLHFAEDESAAPELPGVLYIPCENRGESAQPLRQCHQSHCMVPAMNKLRSSFPSIRGLLMVHTDFWFQPSLLMRSSALDQIWQLDRGLRGSWDEAQFGPYCLDFKELRADDRWFWWGDGKRKAENAVRRVQKDLEWMPANMTKAKVCAGWSDLVYLPAVAWDDYRALSPYFSEIHFEIGLPTMLYILTEHRGHSRRPLLACWGGCCDEGKDPSLIEKYVCGHKLDLRNPAMIAALSQMGQRDHARLVAL